MQKEHTEKNAKKNEKKPVDYNNIIQEHSTYSTQHHYFTNVFIQRRHDYFIYSSIHISAIRK